jgi:hypothetical protein
MKRLGSNAAILLLGVGLGACSAELDSNTSDDTVTSSTQALSAKKRPNSNTTENRKAHAAAAHASLGTLANLVESDRPEKRGFKSTAEAKSSQLATAVPVYMVGLDKLSDYDSSQDPRELLLDLEEAMYPVTVGGEVKSAVFVRKRANGQWEAAEFGRANLAKAVHSHRGAVAARRRVAEADLKMVDIPSLGAKFLGHEEKGELILSAVNDVPGTTIKSGETRPARDVFSTLQPIAEQRDPKALH